MHIESNNVTEWTAKEIAALNADAQRRAMAKLAKRKTAFDEAIEPLKTLVNTVHIHDERAAIIAYVTQELWRR